MQDHPDRSSKYGGAKPDRGFVVLVVVMLVLAGILVYMIRSMYLEHVRRRAAEEEAAAPTETILPETQTVPETEALIIPETAPIVIPETETVSETGAPLDVPEGVDPALVEAMAAYEAYYDAYILYKQKTAESDKPYLALPEYTEALTKYTQAYATVFQIMQRGMTLEEQIYYDKTMDRIHRKLYDAGLRDTLS